MDALSVVKNAIHMSSTFFLQLLDGREHGLAEGNMIDLLQDRSMIDLLQDRRVKKKSIRSACYTDLRTPKK
jgi:hypothetical protein